MHHSEGDVSQSALYEARGRGIRTLSEGTSSPRVYRGLFPALGFPFLEILDIGKGSGEKIPLRRNGLEKCLRCSGTRSLLIY